MSTKDMLPGVICPRLGCGRLPAALLPAVTGDRTKPMSIWQRSGQELIGRKQIVCRQNVTFQWQRAPAGQKRTSPTAVRTAPSTEAASPHGRQRDLVCDGRPLRPFTRLQPRRHPSDGVTCGYPRRTEPVDDLPRSTARPRRTPWSLFILRVAGTTSLFAASG